MMILFPILGFSQIINSNEATIAEFYNGKVNSFELNGAKVTGQFHIPLLASLIHPIVPYENKQGMETAEKINTFYINVGITNTGGNILNLNKFDFKENNGVALGITFQHSFDKIYLAADNPIIRDSIQNTTKNIIKDLFSPFPLQSFTIGLSYQKDKFSNFNPQTKEMSKKTPERIILKIGYSYYFFKYGKEDAKYKYAIIPTVFSTTNLKDYNRTGLQNFLLNDNISVDNNIYFTNKSGFDGKYGIIDNDLKSAQISFSLPIVLNLPFLGEHSKKTPAISPIPYISYEAFDKSKPRINGGIAIGFLTSPLINPEPESKFKYRTFNVPSYITIGVDWNYQNGQGSKPNYFIAGSIKFK